jgi:hypothetical protein
LLILMRCRNIGCCLHRPCARRTRTPRRMKPRARSCRTTHLHACAASRRRGKCSGVSTFGRPNESPRAGDFGHSGVRGMAGASRPLDAPSRHLACSSKPLHGGAGRAQARRIAGVERVNPDARVCVRSHVAGFSWSR